MKELIKVAQNDLGKVVSAKELHEFLGIKTRFNDWVERRIEEYGFVENQDFTKIYSNLSKTKPTTEYVISLDMAKELAMVERNEKGKEARQYFIQCEKEMQKMTSFEKMSSLTVALPHVLRSLEIGKELGVLEVKKMELKSELGILHRLAHSCKFCGKMSKNYHANTQHENYCTQNPVALLSPNAQAKAYATSKKGGQDGQ